MVSDAKPADPARMAEPIHTDSEPRDGWYMTHSTPTDANHPYKTRFPVPVHIWTVVTADEVGERIDDDKQWAQFGDVIRKLQGDEWLYLAKRPLTKEQYDDLYANGTWREDNAYASQYRG